MHLTGLERRLHSLDPKSDPKLNSMIQARRKAPFKFDPLLLEQLMMPRRDSKVSSFTWISPELIRLLPKLVSYYYHCFLIPYMGIRGVVSEIIGDM